MKRFLILIAVVIVGLLAGCQSASENSGGRDPGSADSNESQEFRSFETAKGIVKIPVDPQRIVTDYYLGEFLAVGVKPIIASQYSLSNPFLADLTEGIEGLNTASATTSLEMITASQPDLIVTLSEADYGTYSKIAPTVLIPYGEMGDEELFLYIAEMLGKKFEAEAYLESFRTRAEEAKEEIRGIVGERTVSIVEVWPKEVYAMGSHFARGGTILFDMWELKAPKVVQEKMVDGDTLFEVVSLEVLPEYTGDFIIYGVLADTNSDFLEDSSLWKNLSAVKAGQVMPYEQVAFMHSDPITLMNQLEIYIEFFREYK